MNFGLWCTLMIEYLSFWSIVAHVTPLLMQKLYEISLFASDVILVNAED
jgi:hypothetical protein